MKFVRSSESVRLQMNDYVESAFDKTSCKARTAANLRKQPENLSNCFHFYEFSLNNKSATLIFHRNITSHQKDLNECRNNIALPTFAVTLGELL